MDLRIIYNKWPCSPKWLIQLHITVGLNWQVKRNWKLSWICPYDYSGYIIVMFQFKKWYMWEICSTLSNNKSSFGKHSVNVLLVINLQHLGSLMWRQFALVSPIWLICFLLEKKGALLGGLSYIGLYYQTPLKYLDLESSCWLQLLSHH